MEIALHFVTMLLTRIKIAPSEFYAESVMSFHSVHKVEPREKIQARKSSLVLAVIEVSVDSPVQNLITGARCPGGITAVR